ncbi:MAG: 50S ribosomal protein L9 [Sedimentisphaerales bacterium]|nr:50S ribosomal protein L9 [Sedimentisphaerales bacterium]
MKVLLHTDIPKLGYLGDVVEVSQGYARNYLLPQKLAVKPTEENVKAIEKDRALKTEQRRLANEKLVKVANAVNGAEVNIEALANEQGHLFGSVTEQDIAEALQKKGFEVQTKHVAMTEHFRILGTFDVKLNFAPDIKADVQVNIAQQTDQKNDDQAKPEQQSADGE